MPFVMTTELTKILKSASVRFRITLLILIVFCQPAYADDVGIFGYAFLVLSLLLAPFVIIGSMIYFWSGHEKRAIKNKKKVENTNTEREEKESRAMRARPVSVCLSSREAARCVYLYGTSTIHVLRRVVFSHVYVRGAVCACVCAAER